MNDAKRFKMTWVPQTRRWKKIYKKKSYYFPAKQSETKETSYRRCMQLWEAEKAELDAADENLWRQKIAEQLNPPLANLSTLVASIIEDYGNTPDSRLFVNQLMLLDAITQMTRQTQSRMMA